MKKYFLIFFCFLLSFDGISQTECDYNVSFFLRTRKGKLVKYISKKVVDRKSVLHRYFKRHKQHFFSLTKINYCNYTLRIKKGTKILTLVFNNTKSRTSFAFLGTLPMIDTTIHFYDGLRYRPKSVPLIVQDEMPKMAMAIEPEVQIKLDTANSFRMPSYGNFKSVKVELVKNRIGIDPTDYSSAIQIAEPYGIYLKKEFDIFPLSETRIESFITHNEQYSTKLKLGKVYQLTFTKLIPERTMIVAFFGSFQVVKHNYISVETIKSFAKTHNIKIVKTKTVALNMYTLSFTSNDLKEQYKIISESGLFSLIEPSFLSNNRDISRTKGNDLKPINPLSENGEITIDRVEFYSKIMNDLPTLGLPNFSCYVITRNSMYISYRNIGLKGDIRIKTKMQLSDSMFKAAQFMLTQLPTNYLDSAGNYGDCLVNLNQSSNYNCFTMIVYKSDGTQITLQGNELPRNLNYYYYKAYRYNERLRK